jgi:formylglycine-generating enzyme required for sulfatase activity
VSRRGWRQFAIAGGTGLALIALALVIGRLFETRNSIKRFNSSESVATDDKGQRHGGPERISNSDEVPSEVAAYALRFEASTGIKLMPIPAGSFVMGSPSNEDSRHANEGPQTSVVLTRAFFLGATDVTEAQWAAITGSDPSHTRYLKDITKDKFDEIAGTDLGDYVYFRLDTLPVQRVSWNDAMAFCKGITERERAAGRLSAKWEFTLPTEAQWEYACRAGTPGPYAGDLDAMAWYDKSCGIRAEPHPVGTKQPNAWGLFDMHGNVWQWCLDWYGSYPGGTARDPKGSNSGAYHVFRGGSWAANAASCRSSARNFYPSDYYTSDVGFRLALCPVMP